MSKKTEFYPIPRCFISSGPACREDVWEGGKVHSGLEPQQRKVVLQSVRVIVWVFPFPLDKIWDKFHINHIYYLQEITNIL